MFANTPANTPDFLDRRQRAAREVRALANALGLVLTVALTPVAVAQDQSADNPAADQTTVQAEEKQQAKQLREVVVTATRIPERAFDVPASIDSVQVDDPTNDLPGYNLAEYLRTVQGVRATDRGNYSNGEYVSIRGIGGPMPGGLRFYADGIPATMPDGTSQTSHFSFSSANRIEVLRGPFSALYGNSAGGVVQIFTADGIKPSELLGGIGGGSYGTRRAELGARGKYRGMAYNFDISGFRIDGYRVNSEARQVNGNGKLDFDIGSSGKLILLLNTLAQPHSHNPQALTWEEYRTDRRQASRSVRLFDYKEDKTAHQWQTGALYTQGIGDHQSVRALFYYGQRQTDQILTIPVGAQRNPLSSGGVIDLFNIYSGTDLRWTWKGDLLNRPFDFSIGLAYDNLASERKGYESFIGDEIGVVGALRRNELDRIYNVDEYAQGTWRLAQRWSLTLGARHSTVDFHSHDYYITDRNPDDSGTAAYGATNPVVGLVFRVSPTWHLYASYGHGFDTPTFLQVAYRPNNGSGLNLGLLPARSHNVELGSKWRFDNGTALDIALFNVNTRDEIGVFASAGGRTTYQNVGNSRRRGVEVGLHVPLAQLWRMDVAYTYLDATMRNGTGNCGGSDGCEIPKGARIPGLPQQWVNAQLRWGGDVGWHARLRLEAADAAVADSAGTLKAPGYSIMDANAGYVFEAGASEITPFVRIDNMFDRDYIGSVSVNVANGADFEPAPGRTFWVGVSVRFR